MRRLTRRLRSLVSIAVFQVASEVSVRLLHVPGVIIADEGGNWRRLLGLETNMPAPAFCTDAVQPR